MPASKLPMLQTTGGMNLVISFLMIAVSNNSDSPILWLVIILITAFIGLIPFDNWYRNSRATRMASSVWELEAQFSLEDLRPGPSCRPYRHR
jgi:UDP-N-acetylmuramyl pentapeptide phosphotransferase/UDP-N-acetylglucosamine-1-phosphate transferase